MNDNERSTVEAHFNRSYTTQNMGRKTFDYSRQIPDQNQMEANQGSPGTTEDNGIFDREEEINEKRGGLGKLNFKDLTNLNFNKNIHTEQVTIR